MMAQRSWIPLFSGTSAEPYHQAIDDIAEALMPDAGRPVDWGPTLVQAYLGLARSSSAHLQRAAVLNEQVAERIASVVLAPALYGGIAGAGWLSAHLDGVLGRRDDDVYEEIDEALLAFAELPLRRGYDLISGAVGIGVYFLERLPHPRAVTGLRQIAAGLRFAAEIAEDQATWFTPVESLVEWQRRHAPRGYYNLGVAHGVPGIVGLLAEMRKAGILDVDNERVLRQAVRWVARQQMADGAFPSWIAPGVAPTRTRVAWCYGELGLCITLLHAARVLDDRSMEHAALDLARLVARRRDSAGTRDASLCHGAAGNGHLFNRLFQATHAPEFRDAAEFWLTSALEMRVAGGVGGYRAFRPLTMKEEPREVQWEDNHTFLDGASGVALAFLAATSPVEPRWDRVLLANLDPLEAR